MIRMRDFMEILKRQPFAPFRIDVSDGSEHQVNHPEMIKVANNFVLVFTPKPNQPAAAISDYNLISMLHVTRLEPLVSPGAKHQKA
jgi:hypothetical protein